MKKYMKYLCAVLMIIGTSASAWGESVAASFASGTVVTNDTYTDYENSDWYLSSGGSNKGAGFNSSHHTTIGNAYGTSANTAHHGFYIRSKNKLNNICKITFTYAFCTTATECANAKIYLGYSTNGSSWSAVSLTSGSQGTTIAPSENPTSGSSDNTTIWTFEFANIESAYYAVIVSRNGSMTDGKGFRFDDATVNFYSGCCTALATPTNLTVQENKDYTHGKTRLGWDPVTNNNGYRVGIYRNGSYYATVTKDADKEYVNSTFGVGNWTWKVSAIGSGSYCEENDSVSGPAFCVGADLTAATVSGFSATPLTTTSARISWTEVAGAEYYEVELKEDGKATTVVSDIIIGGNTWDATGLTANKTYRFYWKAVNLCDDAYNSAINSSNTFSIVAHTVDFNLNGKGSGKPSDQLVLHGGKATTPSNPTPPSGWSFAGWYKEAGCTNAWDFDNDVVNADKTLYAKWTANDIAITLDKNNSDVAGSDNGSASIKYDATLLTSISHATRSAHRLDGYYAEVGCTNQVLTAEGALVNYSGYVESGKWVRSTATTLYAKWTAVSYTDYKFSCAELTLTPVLVTAGTPIFITSVANKKVRSQDYITIAGNGLTPNTVLTFPGLPSKFEVLTSTGGTISTDANGEINVNAYIFYTPAADATTDGLDKLVGLTVSVGGAKPKQVSLSQEIIGRHLPTAGYVIAGKKDNKWYALPATMASTGTPDPSEIAVDDINDPSIAYTAASNIYTTEGPTASNISGGNGQYIRFVMMPLWADDADHSKGHAPLFGATDAKIGKSDDAKATSNLSAGWWWALTQKNTSITNPQDAKYSIKCANNSNTLSIKNSPFVWGQYASGVEELRLIRASSVVPTEAYFVEWAQHGGVVEVDAEGIDATSVVAHLGEATSSAITLVETKSGDAKNAKSKYNYTVDFGDGIDFAAAESNGAMLTLEWKNGATTKAVSNIVVPRIIAASRDMYKTGETTEGPWNKEVHVLPGVTLTANAGSFSGGDITIPTLEIYPGATVKVTTGTLTATTLVLRNGWSRAGEKTYDVARLYVTPSTATLKATNVYADWYIDYDQYYPIAVPWNATVANFTYRYCSVSPTVGPDAPEDKKNIHLRYYDGASRATNVQEGVGAGANWKEYGAAGNLAIPTTLLPSHGYVMTARRPSGKAFSIIRMPLTLPSGTWGDGTWTTNGEQGTIGEAPSDEHKDQIAVTAHNTGSTPGYAQGWNLIANPYMSLHQGTITYTEGSELVNYVNIPDVDFKEYSQLPTATTKLAPASAFLIQAPKTGTITFGTTKRVASAPSYRRDVQEESIPEQQAYILLNGNNAEDQMGILVSDKYTAEYELNADLEKLLSDGTSLRTYMRYGDRNMAYVAINEMLAKEWIPVTVRIPAEGEYTFSMHEASIADELEGVYLTDYLTGATTNLLYDSYTFTAEAGTISDRFAINAIIGEHKTPTGIDAASAGADIHSDKPFKFVYRDKVYILHRGVIYDATGKKVREINK